MSIPPKHEVRDRLQEIDLMRITLIILLILYHAFAIFNGAWEALPDYPPNRLYWWISTGSFSFLLELFTFISGYLYGNQVLQKSTSIINVQSTIIKRAKRLLLPNLVFSTIYFLLFCDLHQPLISILYKIISGIGHMWFLPMLFWCFVGIYCIEKWIHIRPGYLFPLLILMCVCSFIPLPFQLTRTMYFMFFFYSAYYIRKENIQYVIPSPPVLTFSAIGLIAFIIFSQLMMAWEQEELQYINNIVQKAIGLSITNALRMISSACSIAWVLLFTQYLIYIRKIKISPKVTILSSYCFGIYLYQLFILKALYYHSDVPSMVSPNILPWLGFCMALIGSVTLSYFTLKTRWGKYLIG